MRQKAYGAIARANTGNRYHSDKAQSERSAREMLRIMLEHKEIFLRMKSGWRFLNAVKSIANRKELLTSKQKSYVSDIWDKFMNSYTL